MSSLHLRAGVTQSSPYLGEWDHFGAQWVDVALCQEETEEQGARSPTLGVDPVGDAGVGVATTMRNEPSASRVVVALFLLTGRFT